MTPRTYNGFRMDSNGTVYDRYNEPCGSVSAIGEKWAAYALSVDLCEHALGIYEAPGQAFRALVIHNGEG